MSNGSGHDEPRNKAELMQCVRDSWSELSRLIGSLSDDELTASRRDGWSVKDHMAHITAWEQSALALLEGRPRHEAMGIAPDEYLSEDVDVVNDAIYQHNKDRSPKEVRAAFERSHRQMLDRLEQMSDEDLTRPYSYYQPDDPEERPVLGWIIGNTCAHYDEHVGWLRSMLEGTP